MTGLQYLVYMEPSKSAVSDGLPPGEDRRVVADGVNTHPRRAGAAGRVRQEDGKCSEWPEKLGYPRVGEWSDRGYVRALTRSILEHDRVGQRSQHQSAPR
jgi:hypothetical protein